MPVPPGYTLDPPATPAHIPAGYVLDGSNDISRPAGLPDGVALGAPADHPAVTMNPPALKTAGQRLLGASPIADLGSVVGSHLKNLVAGPYNALTQGPQSPQEAEEMGTTSDSSLPARALGHVGLAGARMLVNPTLNALKALPDSKDATDVMNHATDAIPVVGPWARGIENDAAQHGAIPALAGLGTDVLAPGIASKLGGTMLKPAARTAAISDVTNMIRPNATDVSFGKSPAEGLLNQPGGIFAGTKEGLLGRSKGNIGRLGQQIGDAVATAPQTPLDISKQVTEPFDGALQDAAKSNQGALLERLKDTRKGLTSDLSYDPQSESIQQLMGPKNLTAVSPSDVFALKKRVGDNTKWTNQAFDNDVNAAQGNVYGGLKQALNTAIPELKPLNENYGNLRSGVSALERRIPIENRQNPISLPDALVSSSAAIAGNPLLGLGGVALKKLLTGTPFRTGVDAGLWRYGNSPAASLRPTLPGIVLRSASQKKNQ